MHNALRMQNALRNAECIMFSNIPWDFQTLENINNAFYLKTEKWMDYFEDPYQDPHFSQLHCYPIQTCV